MYSLKSYIKPVTIINQILGDIIAVIITELRGKGILSYLSFNPQLTGLLIVYSCLLIIRLKIYIIFKIRCTNDPELAKLILQAKLRNASLNLK